MTSLIRDNYIAEKIYHGGGPSGVSWFNMRRTLAFGQQMVMVKWAVIRDGRSFESIVGCGYRLYVNERNKRYATAELAAKLSVT